MNRLLYMTLTVLLSLEVVSCSEDHNAPDKSEVEFPAITDLSKYELHAPLRVYSQDGKLIGEYGDRRRKPLHH